MAIVKWPGNRDAIRTEYRLIFPLDIFKHILFKDTQFKLKLKDKLFILSGISSIHYEQANHPSILLWLEKYRDTKLGWKLIEKTINDHLEQ